MTQFPILPELPAKAEREIKVEVEIDYEECSWRAVIMDDNSEYTGTFMTNRLTGQVTIEWYEIPTSAEWEAIEDELRKTIL